MFFYSRHLCRLNPMPQDVQDVFQWLEKDPTVYLTMYAILFFTNESPADSPTQERPIRVLYHGLAEELVHYRRHRPHQRSYSPAERPLR